MALSAVKHTLSRYQESADKLTTTIKKDSELNRNGWPSRSNSLTFALASVRWASSKVARCSIVSIFATIAEMHPKSKFHSAGNLQCHAYDDLLSFLENEMVSDVLFFALRAGWNRPEYWANESCWWRTSVGCGNASNDCWPWMHTRLPRRAMALKPLNCLLQARLMS